MISQEVLQAIGEITKPRTRFQIEKFVLGAHPTDEMRYVQVLLEIRPMVLNIKRSELQLKKLQIEIDRLKKTGDEIDAIEAEMKDLELQEATMSLVGQKRELEELVEIFYSFPKRYTLEEIEAAQPEYWKQRLTNNVNAMMLGQGLITPSYIESMIQAEILPAPQMLLFKDTDEISN